MLDDRDEFVSVERVTLDGAARTSTVIDLGIAATESEGYTVTVLGVTGLTADDLTA